MSSGSTEEVLVRKKYTVILEYTEERVIRRTTDDRNERVTRNNRTSRQFRHQPYQSPNNHRVRETVTQDHDDDMSNDNNNNPMQCFRCRGPHKVKDCSAPPVSCDYCGKKGHRINSCWNVPGRKKCQSPAKSQSQKVKKIGKDRDASSSSISVKCYRCEGPHMIRNCPQPPTICEHCGKNGHSISNCWYAPHQRGSTHEKGNSSKVEGASKSECQD